MDNNCNSIIKRILFVLVNIVSFPCVYFLELSNGLDPSWIFALNYINNSNAKFGKDHFFTYGPLGFLGRCQSVGSNLYTGILFWILMAVIQIYLYKRLFQYVEHMIYTVIASVLLILALPVSEADIYLCFLNLIALLLVYRYEDYFSKWITVLLSGVIFLFKFSGTVLLIATLLMLLVCALAEKKPVKTVGVFLGCIVIGPVCYLFYNLSMRSLFRYVRAAVEISVGYNTSMSLDIYGAYYIWVVFVVICYVCLLIYGIFTHKKQWNCLLILAPACFFWYKQGFMRNDEHYFLALSGMLLICSLLMFFIDWKEWMQDTERNFFRKVNLYCLCVLMIIPIMGNGKTLSGAMQTAASNMFNFPKLLDHCTKQDRSLLQEHNREFMDLIDGHTYTTFPWEITENISYANQNFKIAPLLQNHMVYTPYLDRLNAEFYTGDDAPEYIIMYLSTIDGRLPLIEAPVTWENIYRNYCVVTADEEKFLLKKRGQALVKEASVVHTGIYNIEDYIEIPENCMFVKIDVKPSIRGHLENLFYKILPVNLEITYTDGTVKAGRVVPDNLSEGIDTGALIRDQMDFINYMNADTGYRSVAGISLTGPGVRQYADRMEVTFYNGSWKQHKE